MKKLLLLGAFLGICTFAQAQLNENFEGTTFPPTGWTIQSGISSIPTYKWKASTTNPIEGLKSAIVAYNPAPADQDENLISPAVTIPAGSPTLNFKTSLSYYWSISPNENYDFIVSISTNGGTTWTPIWDETQLGVFANFAVQSISIPLTTYAGMSNVKFKFNYSGNDGANLSLDDIKIVTCGVPTGFQYTVAPTTSSATIGWAVPSTGTPTGGYQVEWGPQGFTPGTGTIANPTTPSYTFTPLNPNTIYQFRVRTNCGGFTGFGDWSGLIAFAPEFTATNVPYTTGFEGQSNFAFLGWTEATPETPTTLEGWGINAVTTPNATVQEGLQSAFTFAPTATASDAWLISRGVNLTAGQLATISYWVRNFVVAPATGSLKYDVTTGTSATVASQSTIIFTEPGMAAGDAFVQRTHTFTPSTTGVYYFGFHHTSALNAGDHAMLLDNVSITQGTAGTNDVLASNFAVFPNPATNRVTVAGADTLVNGIELVDLNGRTVKTIKLNGVAEAEVNISDLSAGVYMMNISSDKGVATKKIVKQ